MLKLAPPNAEEELFEKAAAALQRMLAVEPRNAAALARLGDLERRRGDFAAALTACRCLLAVAPDDAEAAWAVAVLGGDRLPEAPPPVGRIVPFVRLTDFLPSALRDRLLRDVPAASERFAPGSVTTGADEGINLGVRNVLVLDEPTRREVRSRFLCLHEITPVTCGAEFGDGRFTVTGWISGVRRCAGA